MRHSLLFVFLALVITHSHSHQVIQWSEATADMYTFEHYIVQFNRSYEDDSEYEVRKAIYQKNLEKIRAINADPKNTWKAAVNHLVDRTPEELQALKGYNRDLGFFAKNQPVFKIEKVEDLPESLDWREKGVVQKIKNQRSCGSCWAFSATSVMEANLAIETGKLVDLSEQQLVSCMENPQQCGGTGGCSGATQWLGFEYAVNNGMTTQDSYPYTGRDSTCDQGKVKKVAKFAGFARLPTNDYDALLTAVATKGPIAVSVAADAWSFYDSGIYNGNCGTTINHAVTAVGYGTDPKHGNYWIIRNSWGESWGEKGHIRIAREKSAADVKCGVDKHPEQGSGCKGGPTEITVCGLCGIYSDSSYIYGGSLQ